MTTIHPDNRQGNQTLAQWMSPSDFATCPRCGIPRRINASRAGRLCRDCWLVERLAARIEPEPAVGVWVNRRGVRVLTNPEEAA